MLPTKRIQRTDQATWYGYIRKDYHTQAKPYNLMLPMNNVSNYVKILPGASRTSLNATSGNPFGTANEPIWTSLRRDAGNRSYKKLVSQIGDASSFGSTLTAESRETFGMLLGSVQRGVAAARKIRRFDFAGAARDLGLPFLETTRTVRVKTVIGKNKRGQKVYRRVKIQKTYIDFGDGRDHAKTLASGWLMYSYGIKPLMEDCYNAADILTRFYPWVVIEGTAKASTSSHVKKQTPTSAGIAWYDKKQTWTLSMKQSFKCRIRNPNLFRASQMGLVNPAQFAMEAITLSFVVDWFSNLSEVIMSLTDFVGLDVIDPCVNIRKDYVYTKQDFNPFNPPNQRLDAGVLVGCNTVRELALVLPKLTFRYERFQWQRGANAISLLLGLIGPGRNTKH